MKQQNILGISMLVGACLSGCASVPTVNSPLPAGTWAGIAEQHGPGSLRMQFDTQVTLNGAGGGTISYAHKNLRCGGRLGFSHMVKSIAVYRERIEYGSSCIDNGMVSMEILATGQMIFSWQSPGITAVGRLLPASG